MQIEFRFSGYHCYCEDGYTGQHCQTDWDECWSDPCLNGATCIDQVADYNCSCAPGFRGNINHDILQMQFRLHTSWRESTGYS